MYCEYAAVLITADSVRDGIHGAIAAELFSLVECRVILSGSCQLESYMIPVMYRKIRFKHYYKSVVRSMTCCQSIFYIVSGNAGLCEKLCLVKGLFREVEGELFTSGLRAKYKLSVEEYVSLGYSGEALKDKVFEPRLHVSSNLEETAVDCLIFMKDNDLVRLEKLAPLLYREVERVKKIVNVRVNK